MLVNFNKIGGNAVAVTTQRLLAEKQQLPKLQILIYPWTQLVNLRLPSATKYLGTGILSSFSSSPSKFVAWYLGIHCKFLSLSISLTEQRILKVCITRLKKFKEFYTQMTMLL